MWNKMNNEATRKYFKTDNGQPLLFCSRHAGTFISSQPAYKPARSSACDAECACKWLFRTYLNDGIMVLHVPLNVSAVCCVDNARTRILIIDARCLCKLLNTIVGRGLCQPGAPERFDSYSKVRIWGGIFLTAIFLHCSMVGGLYELLDCSFLLQDSDTNTFINKHTNQIIELIEMTRRSREWLTNWFLWSFIHYVFRVCI